jgi:uncharacterized protein involved in type VI secretion and phage assembly
VHRVVHTIRNIARHEIARQWHAAFGVVKSVKAGDHYCCTIELRESHLVLPDVPIMVGVMGAAAPPDPGDLVLVIFAGGDLHAPVVVGRVYSDQIAPPQNSPGEFVLALPGAETSASDRLDLRIKTPGNGTRELKVTLDGDIKVELAISDNAIQLRAKDTVLKLMQSGGSDGKAELKAGNNSVTIEQSGNVTIEAEGTLTLKASKVEISGDAEVKIAGQTVNLN